MHNYVHWNLGKSHLPFGSGHLASPLLPWSPSPTKTVAMEDQSIYYACMWDTIEKNSSSPRAALRGQTCLAPREFALRTYCAADCK